MASRNPIVIQAMNARLAKNAASDATIDALARAGAKCDRLAKAVTRNPTSENKKLLREALNDFRRIYKATSSPYTKEGKTAEELQKRHWLPYLGLVDFIYRNAEVHKFKSGDRVWIKHPYMSWGILVGTVVKPEDGDWRDWHYYVDFGKTGCRIFEGVQRVHTRSLTKGNPPGVPYLKHIADFDLKRFIDNHKYTGVEVSYVPSSSGGRVIVRFSPNTPDTVKKKVWDVVRTYEEIRLIKKDGNGFEVGFVSPNIYAV